MKTIGNTATQARTPKAAPPTTLKAKSAGSKGQGKSPSTVTGLRAKGLGAPHLGRDKSAITSIKAPK